MNLHEYQAKELLKKYGVPVPDFAVASKWEEALEAISKMKLKEAVFKIQVHAGGRGKAGGVRFAKSLEEMKSIFSSLCGMKMVNAQTGPDGVIARQILISSPIDISKEFYLAVVIDRSSAQLALIASCEGGVEIEEIAVQFPDRILKLPIAPIGKLRSYQCVRLAKFMQWEKEVAKQGIALAQRLIRCFMESDAELLEINPLVLTSQGNLVALDAKMSLDDNALFRHPDLASSFDASQLTLQEAEAKQHDLSYIAMGGNIGCMVNGAGLAMATMDMIELEGGSPANFLDVGGSADEKTVSVGFQIILSDLKVKVLLVNIFGGIMNCATIAQGVLLAAKELSISLPLVVRLEGTNAEEGMKLFTQSGLNIITTDDLANAAKASVMAARG